MTEALIAALAALGGASLGFVAAWYTARSQRLLQQNEWAQERRDAVARDTRLALAEVITCVAKLAHSVMWFTSLLLRPGRDDEDQRDEIFDRFENEAHHLIAETVGAQYRLAALSTAQFDSVTPLVSDAIRLVSGILNAPSAGDSDQWLKWNQGAYNLIKTLPDHITGLLREEEHSTGDDT